MAQLLKNKPAVVCEIHEAGAGQRVLEQLLANGYRVTGIEDGRPWTSWADVAPGHIYAIA